MNISAILHLERLITKLNLMIILAREAMGGARIRLEFASPLQLRRMMQKISMSLTFNSMIGFCQCTTAFLFRKTNRLIQQPFGLMLNHTQHIHGMVLLTYRTGLRTQFLSAERTTQMHKLLH
jgi:hypothetical protein